MTNRFYIGSEHISKTIEEDGDHVIVTTLPDAIARAKERISSGKVDVLYIVEIVRIVRRKPVETPIVVEETR